MGINMQEAKRQIVNIVNFVRGCEPRTEVDLVEPVAQQLKLLEKHGFKGTFLFQYDALVSGAFDEVIEKIKLAGHETGVWLEIVEPLTKACGIGWRGRFPWDWHANTGFSVGYNLSQREQLIDALFEKYRSVFGAYPRVIGSWIIDAHSLKYACDKYGLDASCNCKDQWGTDGYTLWGAYYNQAYYPSVHNVFCPAADAAQQINVPVFRMLGSDPVYQYDAGLDVNGEAAERQGVVTLEPVYCEGGGGANKAWVDWYLKENFSGSCLSFGYTQAGQENSFGWSSMKDGLNYQFERFAQLEKDGCITVETLGDSGRWYKSQYALTPASTVSAESDWLASGKKSVWYSCKSYRVNLYADGDTFFVRDMHIFDGKYRERYFDNVCTDSVLKYDNLPVIDGNRWSGCGTRAGMFFCRDGKELSFGDMRYEETDSSTAVVTFSKTQCGEIKLVMSESGITVTAEKPDGFGLELRCGKNAVLPEVLVKSRNRVMLRHNGFNYNVRLSKGAFSEDMRTVNASDGVIEFSVKGSDAMPKLGIRPIRTDDRDAALRFFSSMSDYSASFFNVNRGNELRTLLFLDGGNTDHVFWVSEDDGTLAGLVFIWDKDSLVPWLGIAVNDAYQGRHVGMSLLTHVIDYAKQNGCGGLLLTTAQTNYKAQGLYEKCGFERLGVHPSGEFLYLLRFNKDS